MSQRLLAASTAAVIAALTLTASAAGDETLGSTTMPSGGNPFGCGSGNVQFAQYQSDPSTPFAAPSDGYLTSWSVNTATGAAAGASVAVLVVDTTDHVLTAMNSQTLPTPLPASGISTFTITNPIPIATGEVLGVTAGAYSGASLTCEWGGGATPTTDLAPEFNSPSPFAAPTTLNPFGSNVAGSVSNVSAQFVNTEDAGVTTAAGPDSPTAGQLATFTSTISNAGPLTQPITFTDTVPSGMTVQGASTGAGPCTTSGQTVTCTLSGIAIGQTASVAVLVTPSAAGNYTNNVSVGVGSLHDPASSNNAASAQLKVAAAPGTSTVTTTTTTTTTTPVYVTVTYCRVPTLTRLPATIAARVLKLLNCTVGKTTKQHSKVPKGEVIGTKPGMGTLKAGTTVSLIVSSGPAKKHR